MLFSKYSDVLIKRSAKPRCGLLGMCLLVVLCSHVSWARDLGQFANDYPINEPDAIDSLIGQVKEKVASGEWDKIQQEAQKRLSEQIQNPPTLAGIGSTQKNKTWK